MKMYRFHTQAGHSGRALSTYSLVIARGLLAAQLGVPQLSISMELEPA